MSGFLGRANRPDELVPSLNLMLPSLHCEPDSGNASPSKIACAECYSAYRFREQEAHMPSPRSPSPQSFASIAYWDF